MKSSGTDRSCCNPTVWDGSDADYVHEANDRRSVFVEVVVCAGVCVSLYSRTQKFVTLSPTGAEYVAMTTGFGETIFHAISPELFSRTAMLGVPR